MEGVGVARPDAGLAGHEIGLRRPAVVAAAAIGGGLAVGLEESEAVRGMHGDVFEDHLPAATAFDGMGRGPAGGMCGGDDDDVTDLLGVFGAAAGFRQS